MAIGRSIRSAAGLLAATAVAGCGGASSHTTTHRSAVAPPSRHSSVAFVTQPRRALVTMRAYSPESLMWQTVSLRGDGSGILTTLIGEATGALRKSFRLPAAQAAELRNLVARARPLHGPASHDPRAVLYTLRISGKPSANIQGGAPRPLERLVGFLSGLMQSYCC